MIPRRRFLELSGTGALAAFAGCSAGPRRAEDDVSALLVRQPDPFNAEPPLPMLAESWLTPLRAFYVRRHGNVPAVDPSAYVLSVDGLVERPLRLTIGDLSALPQASGVATLQCAGNRRSEHSKTKKVGGVPWDAGAVGNASWSGVPLAEILQRAGVKGAAKHVQFASLDRCKTPAGETAFGASIPVAKAMAPETLVATAMGDAPLSPEHGYPARTLVPGWIGARSVKWLGSITLSDRPSDNFFQARDYKLFTPEVTAETARWESADALNEMPVNSAICQPASGSSVPAGRLRLRGYAVAPAGRAVTRVEVSLDGKTWTAARLSTGEAPFAWRLWEAELDVRPGPALLAVRATESSGATQPETAPWNFKGYVYNGWHRVPVTVA
jgi:sulfite oxidase